MLLGCPFGEAVGLPDGPTGEFGEAVGTLLCPGTGGEAVAAMEWLQ